APPCSWCCSATCSATPRAPRWTPWSCSSTARCVRRPGCWPRSSRVPSRMPDPIQPAARTLYQWFAASVARVPDAVAVEVDGAAVTYRELDDLSARLAARIAAECGELPRRVGLLASRSLLAFAG